MIPTLLLCFRLAAAAEELPDSLDITTLEEITVTGQSARQRISHARLGSESLELTKLALTPQLFGETDIVKSITLLPGVHSEAEGAGGFEVRGGNAYQILVTMDGMTLYNPAHLMGVFSTFNDDAMSSATLHKGPIPASLGGASSSVLETFMKAGDMTKYHFSGTVGLLNAKLAADGPIVNNKLSFSVAARRSYVDLFLKLIPQYKNTIMNFWDVNARIHYKANENNYLDGSFFAARDHLAISELMSMQWGNIAGSLNWHNRAGDNWNFITTAAITDYTTNAWMNVMDSNQKIAEFIKSYSVNEDASYSFSDSHRIRFGIRSELLRVMSGKMKVAGTTLEEVRAGWQNAIWIDYEGDLAKWFSISAGCRLSLFSSISSDRFHAFNGMNEPDPDFSSRTYFNPEPRVSVKFIINDNHNVKAGVSMATQNIHGIRSTTSSFPFDRYALTSANVKPENATQYSLGYVGMTPDGAWDWSVEGYYKSIDNVYDYKDGMNMGSRMNLESLILGGRGRSYGMEFMLRKNSGKLTGWISYTLSRTQTRIDGINGGNWYNASNDRTHDVAVVAIYNFNSKWNVSASWTYSSGKPLTAPDEKYEVAGTTCYYYAGRNTYKTPASHRLDLSANYTMKRRNLTHLISFGVYNAYSYQSPFVIYFEDDPSKPSGTRAVQQSLFGILPSISYTLQF